MSDNKLTLREDYKRFYPITTRWMDNDFFGHINNVNYYSFFDTTINRFLIETGHGPIKEDTKAFYVVHSSCNYISSIAYPQEIEAGLIAKKIGESSVTYGLGIFIKKADTVSAFGEFVHVYVDRLVNKPLPIPQKIRQTLILVLKESTL